ncbi:hypothetical protein LO772_34690 [Yinghuangia sp. ASG 101]|uniref:DUF4286 family protein n=1 Tax=Yinghuangia sp. ASG 101 TaxID=2896848 RepID=UPI001E4F762F|nr:DUF4286 family protein [Yinghuangia sp. ASG 101]UGQ11855.1 hypothetical protein LO772_34690 [Yinghuangia sp. ASG 101]
MADRTLYMVFSNPLEGRDDEFNAWYDTVHVRDVLAVPGMVSAQRYDLRDTEMYRAAGGGAHRYCVVYEMDGDPDVVMAKVRESVASGAMVMHEALDLRSVSMSFWSPRGPQVRSSGAGA